MKPLILIYFVCLFFTNLLISQPSFNEKNQTYYNLLDSLLINENRNIYNGLEYVDKYRCWDTDNHKFYENYNFFNGTVVYAGEPYFNLKLKYSLLDDLVILEFVNEKVNYIRLNSSLVESFVLSDSKFVRLPVNAELEPFYSNGFFKEIHNKNNKYGLYVKYKKGKHKIFKYDKLYYKFSKKITFVLCYGNSYFKINSKKDLIKAIPNKKKEIQEFYSKNSRIFKLNEEQFYEKLFNKLNKSEKVN